MPGSTSRSVVPDVDEVALRAGAEKAGMTEPADIAQALAEAKACEVSRRHAGALVIGADQVLGLADEIVTKARDAVDARAKLQALRGRWHTLISALATAKNGEITWRHVEYAELHVRDFSDEWLKHMLHSRRCVDQVRRRLPLEKSAFSSSTR